MTADGTVVLDLDGVLYRGEAGVPGVADALTQLRSAGWHLVYATNNSTKTADLVAEHIEQRTGFSIDPTAVVTSAAVAAQVCSLEHSSAYVVGPDAVRIELAVRGISIVDASEAEAIIVGLDRNLTYSSISVAASAIRRGATFIGTNLDPTFPTPTGLEPGAGTVVGAVEIAADTQPIICGKPTQVFSAAVGEHIQGDDVWMVGDRPDTDLAMAIDRGWRSALVMTGVTSAADVVPAKWTPDAVLNSVADLPAILGKATR
ncbi:MAG: HAD-IIA family hydrolase [Acidimicrobiia bacterium]